MIAQGTAMTQVAQAIAFELRCPELDPGFRNSGKRASRVTMPEATMNKNYAAPGRKDQIRASRQICAMEAVPDVERADEPADNFLRTGIRGADTSHNGTAFFGRDGIHRPGNLV